MVAPLTEGIVNFVTNTVGWKTDAQYNALSSHVIQMWVSGDAARAGSVNELRQAVAADPKLRVLIGYSGTTGLPLSWDCSCRHQIAVMGDPARVAIKDTPAATCSLPASEPHGTAERCAHDVRAPLILFRSKPFLRLMEIY